jgi:3-oxoacyl-[acyl-carrier protein] reductase
MNLAGKVALVTGSSRGIGKATALQMGQLGANVAVTYIQAKDEGSACCCTGASQVDVADADAVRVLVHQCYCRLWA